MHSLPYTARPERIANPRAELAALIVANADEGCEISPTIGSSLLVERAVCPDGVSTIELRFNRIQSMEIFQQGPMYRLRIQQLDSADVFALDSASRDDVERAYDSIVSLSRSVQTEPHGGQSERAND